MVCSAKPYNQRLAVLSTYHQLTPMPRRHHIYDVGGRGGAMHYNAWVPGGRNPLRFFNVDWNWWWYGVHSLGVGLGRTPLSPCARVPSAVALERVRICVVQSWA